MSQAINRDLIKCALISCVKSLEKFPLPEGGEGRGGEGKERAREGTTFVQLLRERERWQHLRLRRWLEPGWSLAGAWFERHVRRVSWIREQAAFCRLLLPVGSRAVVLNLDQVAGE